jgi:hypothetical protein
MTVKGSRKLLIVRGHYIEPKAQILEDIWSVQLACLIQEIIPFCTGTHREDEI